MPEIALRKRSVSLPARMHGTEWILIDTETSGLIRPVFCVELAAQKMRGISPEGPPFRALLNHDVEIDAMAESIHGYSRVFLRHHGRDPVSVHQEFEGYAGGLPVVAFNLSFDWARVLAPELARLGLAASYRPGFCALTLARRCIHEVAGHGLQRLRAHFFPYHRGAAHRALDDVLLTVKLVVEIIWPRLERAGVTSFDEIAKFSRATPIQACRQRLHQPSGPAMTAMSPSPDQSGSALETELALNRFVERLALSPLLGNAEIAEFRDWLAARRGHQSELAMRCRGLVEVAFGATLLMSDELIQLRRRFAVMRDNSHQDNSATVPVTESVHLTSVR